MSATETAVIRMVLNGSADDPVSKGAQAVYTSSEITTFFNRGASNDTYTTSVQISTHIFINRARPNISFDFSNTRGVFLGVGTYVGHNDPSDFRIFYGGYTTCGDAKKGHPEATINITKARYELVPGDANFHATALEFTFSVRCSGVSGLTTGSFSLTDIPTPGATEVTGPSGGNGGSGGGGIGGGTGGDGGGTSSTPSTPPDIQVGTLDALGAEPIGLVNGSSASLPLHFYSLTGFTSDLALTATSDSPENNDFHVSITPDSIGSPGEGDATLKIDAGATALPRDYIVTVSATTNEQTPRTFFTTYLVTLNCDPPMILGLDQPKSQSVTRGASATLTVKPTGSGPFTYQWFNGSPGLTWSPVSGATKSNFTTPAVNDTNTYWVRISNACGSVDSSAATVSPK